MLLYIQFLTERSNRILINYLNYLKFNFVYNAHLLVTFATQILGYIFKVGPEEQHCKNTVTTLNYISIQFKHLALHSSLDISDGV